MNIWRSSGGVKFKAGKWHGLFPRMPSGDGAWAADLDMAGFLVRRPDPSE